MYTTCGECGHEYEPEPLSDDDSCPDCGFGPEDCSHPDDEIDSEFLYDPDQGENVEQEFCNKCGLNATAF